jgi:hypothetical protein
MTMTKDRNNGSLDRRPRPTWSYVCTRSKRRVPVLLHDDVGRRSSAMPTNSPNTTNPTTPKPLPSAVTRAPLLLPRTSVVLSKRLRGAVSAPSVPLSAPCLSPGTPPYLSVFSRPRPTGPDHRIAELQLYAPAAHSATTVLPSPPAPTSGRHACLALLHREMPWPTSPSPRSAPPLTSPISSPRHAPSAAPALLLAAS